jgi:ribosome-associated protein
MKVHGALRRQKQLIGKLMRETDPEPIRAALHEFGRHDVMARDVFQASERWRDRIAAEGQAALPEFFELTGGDNRVLREQTRSYEAATHHKARSLIRRRIFAEIHKELASKMQSTRHRL